MSGNIWYKYDLAADVNLDHFTKMMSVSFSTVKLVFSPLQTHSFGSKALNPAHIQGERSQTLPPRERSIKGFFKYAKTTTTIN